MTLKNNTDYPDEKVKEIIRFAKPDGVSKFNVTIRNRSWGFSGRHRRAGTYRYLKISNGTVINEELGFHKDIQIVASITTNESEFPQKVDKRRGGYLPLFLLSREEVLVYVLAHELRHAWQTEHKRGRVWRAKGEKYSERDADAYAIRIVREWRRESQRKQEMMLCFPYEYLFSLGS